MEQAEPSARPLLNAAGIQVDEELRPSSPASTGSTSEIPATTREFSLEQCQSLSTFGGEVGEDLRWPSRTSLLSMTEVPATTRENSRASLDPTLIQTAVQPQKRPQTILARMGTIWKRRMQNAKRAWNGSLTAETCSFIISIIALAGLVATLLAHQNKPLPQWPQSVTINSIISLCALIMRACVGVVLAEGCAAV